MIDKMTIEQAIEMLIQARAETFSRDKVFAFDMAIEALAKQKWHKYAEEKPAIEGQYLCCKFITNRPRFVVYEWSNDLYTVDDFDFLECKGKSGFYEYDSEWGYCEIDCSYWKPIDWESEE